MPLIPVKKEIIEFKNIPNLIPKDFKIINNGDAIIITTDSPITREFQERRAIMQLLYNVLVEDNKLVNIITDMNNK